MGKFERALKRIGLPEGKIEECLQHEGAHFSVASERGYKPMYNIEVSRWVLFGKRTYPAFNYSIVLDKDPSYEDLVAIAMAPENPSKYDYQMVQEFKK
jgi:hypothetical protein